jgi:hypothetical protein
MATHFLGASSVHWGYLAFGHNATQTAHNITRRKAIAHARGSLFISTSRNDPENW